MTEVLSEYHEYLSFLNFIGHGRPAVYTHESLLALLCMLAE